MSVSGRRRVLVCVSVQRTDPGTATTTTTTAATIIRVVEKFVTKRPLFGSGSQFVFRVKACALLHLPRSFLLHRGQLHFELKPDLLGLVFVHTEGRGRAGGVVGGPTAGRAGLGRPESRRRRRGAVRRRGARQIRGHLVAEHLLQRLELVAQLDVLLLKLHHPHLHHLLQGLALEARAARRQVVLAAFAPVLRVLLVVRHELALGSGLAAAEGQ